MTVPNRNSYHLEDIILKCVFRDSVWKNIDVDGTTEVIFLKTNRLKNRCMNIYKRVVYPITSMDVIYLDIPNSDT